jgi:hypothetical protein
MANGHAARQLLEPLAAPDVAIELGSAMASAAAVLCLAGAELTHGGIAPATARAGAERIYALFELSRTMPDFEVMAREQGLRAMRGCLNAEFYQEHGPGAGEATLRNLVDTLLFAVREVAEFQRAMAH